MRESLFQKSEIKQCQSDPLVYFETTLLAYCSHNQTIKRIWGKVKLSCGGIPAQTILSQQDFRIIINALKLKNLHISAKN